ncbi:MAG: acyltransferase family protein [Saprospiraceae bacterium]
MNTALPKPLKGRLLSLDVFRGLTIALMVLVNTPGSWSHVYAPFLHAKWHGCTLTDLVFPNFVFIVGVSMAFSLAKYTADGQNLSKGPAFAKILKRTAMIFLVGLCLNWFPFYHLNIGDLRVHGVLQRIALAYGLAASLCVLLPPKHWLSAAIGLALLYWGILVVGADAGVAFTLEDNFKRTLDLLTVGEKHMYGGFGMPFDPEGLIGMISTGATALLGAFAGYQIRKQPTKLKAVKVLLVYGAALIVAGQLLNLVIPINKPLWTSSYVMYAGGIAAMVLGTLLYLIDVKSWKGWTAPFVHFGTNPLIVYAFSSVFVNTMYQIVKWTNDAGKETNLYSFLWESVYSASIAPPKLASLMFALSVVATCWAFAYSLYRKSIFIKL